MENKCDYPYEFIEWKEKNAIYNVKTNLYLYWEDKFSLEKLFEYWKRNIKDEL